MYQENNFAQTTWKKRERLTRTICNEVISVLQTWDDCYLYKLWKSYEEKESGLVICLLKTGNWLMAHISKIISSYHTIDAPLIAMNWSCGRITAVNTG